MRTSPSITAVSAAILEVQRACPFVDKSKTADLAGHYTYKYAPHEAVWSAVKDLCHQHGLLISQGGREGAGASKWLVTRAIHVPTGEWIETDLPMETAKAGMQALGAAISYCRRVALLAILGIVAKGDDTDAAGDHAGRAARPPRVEPSARPAGVPPDALAIIERVLSEIPRLNTIQDLKEAGKQLEGIVPKSEDARVRKAFYEHRKRILDAQRVEAQRLPREPGSDG